MSLYNMQTIRAAIFYITNKCDSVECVCVFGREILIQHIIAYCLCELVRILVDVLKHNN